MTVAAERRSGRWLLYAAVRFLPNDLGVPAGSVGFVLDDFGDAYEVEVPADDGATRWLGSVSDEFLDLVPDAGRKS